MRCDLEGYRAKLSERLTRKDRGILSADGLHEIRILIRVITYHPAKARVSRDVDARSGSEAR